MTNWSNLSAYATTTVIPSIPWFSFFLRFFRINGIIWKYEIEPFCWSPGRGYSRKVWQLQSVCRLFRGNFELWCCYNVVCLWFSFVYHLILLKICKIYELGISCYFVVLNWRCVWFVATGFQASAASHPSHKLLRFSTSHFWASIGWAT